MNKRPTILVLDDEPDVVQSVMNLLRLEYTVLGATTSKQGAQLMHEHQVDVVMTDQRMPEMTGVQFLAKMKGPFPETTRLLFTGYADIRAVIEAINQGNVYRYITKPWNPDELQSIIREACDRHDLLVQRRELLDELERKNAELERANKGLGESNELKTAFIHVASHELRTPLTILSGYSQLAARAGPVPEPLRDLLAGMQGATDRLQYLINQVISMLQAGDFRAQLNRKATDLPELIAGAVNDVEPFLTLRHQRLARQWPADLGSMELDAAKIRDCINHLLLNAIKFTPDDGTITVQAKRNAAGGLDVGIADTGSGIDEAGLKRFGEPFFTGYDVMHHSSGVYEYGRRGLGLGVSVVKKFVEMHGGQMHVRSALGQGTTVTLSLPPAPPAAS